MLMRARKYFDNFWKEKNHVMVMFACMNVLNTSAIKLMNEREQQQLCPSLICKSLWKIYKFDYEDIKYILVTAKQL